MRGVGMCYETIHSEALILYFRPVTRHMRPQFAFLTNRWHVSLGCIGYHLPSLAVGVWSISD